MKNLFLPLFIFVSYIANAQFVTLLDTNAVWMQGIKNCTNNGLTVECGAWDYFNFQLNNGDTVINGNTYRKVNDYNYDDFNTLPYAYLREDSGRVYMKYDAEIYTPLYSPSLHSTAYISDTTEFVLYDFTLQVGDTFTTRIYKCGLSTFINEGDSITYNQPFILVSIDTVTLNNSALRKRYSLEPIINWNSNQYFGPDLEWIEGIGSTGTFFYNEVNFMTGCGGDFGFRNFAIACYTLNDTILWGVENCLFPTVVNENIAKESTRVFPNPVADILSIQSPINYTNYAVYNTLGSVVQSGAISTNSIDFSALKNGIYILSLTSKNSRPYRAIITK